MIINIKAKQKGKGTMIAWINRNIFGPALPVLLIAVGIYFFVICRGFWIMHPVRVIRSMLKKGDSPSSPSPVKTVTVALAGTLGVGNIAGVATAITAGGAGAIFWMWISALAAMGIKYAEIVLAQKYRVRDGDKYIGGAAYYIRNGIKSRGISAAFSILCIFSSFTIGNIVQSKASADAMQEVFGADPRVIGAAMAIVTCAVVLGGIKWVGNFSAAVIPALSIVYIVLSVWVIFTNLSELPRVFRDIFTSAFGLRSAVGGAAGYAVMRSLRFGAARGIMSNEAGCGTAPTVHAEANAAHPAEQGFWGLFEVFVDTIVLCTMTALVILIAFGEKFDSDGTILAIRAYEKYFGGAAGWIIGISILLYAIASIICWSYYGCSSLLYLGGGENARRVYVLIYGAVCIWGAVAAPSAVWELADLSISSMTILNVCCVCVLGREVSSLTKAYFSKKQAYE